MNLAFISKKFQGTVPEDGSLGRMLKRSCRAVSSDGKKEAEGRQLSETDGAKKPAESAVLAPVPAGIPALPDFGQWGSVSQQRLSPLARATAERLSLAWRVVPHVTQHDVADITELEAARKHYNEEHQGSKPKLTATASPSVPWSRP